MAAVRRNTVLLTRILTVLTTFCYCFGAEHVKCDSTALDYFECMLNQNKGVNMCAGTLDNCVCTETRIRCTGLTVNRLNDLSSFLTNSTETISLTDGYIPEIPADMFGGLLKMQPGIKLDSLVTLDLSNNQITTIVAGAFNKLRMLKSLDLSNNVFFVSGTTPEMFSGLESLETLKLNNVTKLTPHTSSLSDLASSNMSRLTQLELASNLIEELPADFQTFLCSNDMLRNLNLSHNMLNQIDVPSCMLNLRKLDLSNNKLEYLSRPDLGMLDSFMNLDDLRLGYNPYDCSCMIGDTFHWLNVTQLPLDKDNIRCITSTDDTFTGARVADLVFEKVCEPPEIVICPGPGGGGVQVAGTSLFWVLVAGVVLVLTTVIVVVVIVKRRRRRRQNPGPSTVSESPVYTRMA